jgi:hypothetical protein
MFKKFENSSTKTIIKQSMSWQTPLRVMECARRSLTENLNMCHIPAKVVPQLLTNDHKRVNLLELLFKKAKKDQTSISMIITGDESWIYDYDPETKQQSTQWKGPQSPNEKKSRQV